MRNLLQGYANARVPQPSDEALALALASCAATAISFVVVLSRTRLRSVRHKTTAVVTPQVEIVEQSPLPQPIFVPVVEPEPPPAGVLPSTPHIRAYRTGARFIRL